MTPALPKWAPADINAGPHAIWFTLTISFLSYHDIER